MTALRDKKRNHCKQDQAATDQTMVSWSNAIFWGNPKALTLGPRTPTTDWVRGLPTDQSTDYPY